MSRKRVKINLIKQSYRKEFPLRNIGDRDAKSLGELMYHGCRNTIDYEDETIEEFITEVQNTLEGQYGPFLQNCFFLIEVTQKPVAATIISLFKGVTLVTYTVTHPDHVNNGYSTYLIKKSMDALLTIGYKELYLVVTVGNESARHIYNKLGFTEIYGEWDEILANDLDVKCRMQNFIFR
jgi:predicted GNAT family acetyltransferase